MTIRERIEKSVFQAIDNINIELPVEKKLVKSADTKILNSLEEPYLEKFASIIQKYIDEEFNMTIIFYENGTLVKNGTPFANVATLVHYIALSM